MANFVSRNVLICVVPAVVLLLSVYWFRKKKKMKPDLSSINENTLSVSKSNDVYDSRGSIYSSVECTSDFSNTLSDASSISSPESSLHTPSISGEALSETTVGGCIETLAVSNHIGKINYHDVISITKENLIENSNSQIQINETSKNSIKPLVEMKQLVSVDCKNNESSEDPKQLKETLVSSLCVNSPLDASEKISSENEVNEASNDTSDFNDSLHCSDINSEIKIEKQEQMSINSEFIIHDVDKTADDVKQTGNKLFQDSNANVESDSHDSHSSVLDENSLSSVSDESERQTDFKYKDSPSSVFGGNSISDFSDKTDISNEQNLKTDKSYKSNVDYVNDINSVSPSDSLKEEKYAIKLKKNSFLVKAIMTSDASDKISNLSFVENSPSSSHHSYSVLPDSICSLSSEESLLCINKDSSVVDQHNNQSVHLSKDADSSEDSNYNSSVAASLTSEIISLDSEHVISSTSNDEKCNKAEGQSEITVDNLCNEAAVTSTDDIDKEAVKVNGIQMPIITHAQSVASSETVKYQDEQLEQNENKVADLDMVDMKSTGVVPGLFVYEFDLPQELCGRLIGKQGKHVKSIKERTNANVFIKRHPFDTNLKTVVVEGSRSSVFEALDIIRRKFPPSQFPTVTLIQTNMISSHGVLPESLQLHLPEGASCDVILSSLVSADHFFLQQPTHPTYPSLSTLDQCMITCYTQMDTPLLPQPVEAGVICAAPVLNGWYRAQIVYVFENRTECEIKFVDYGGFSQVSISSLRQIRSDFMTLPFQASECHLANVRPVDPNAGWSNEATSVFEELAQGQILQALLVEYAEDGIPCVHLYRVQGVSNMFINRELVERGLAVWVDNGHWDPH